MSRASMGKSMLAGSILAAAASTMVFGHNGGPALLPKEITWRKPPEKKRKDKNDLKRRKPLRDWVKRKFRYKQRPPSIDERHILLVLRDREIGVHPKYRNGSNKYTISAEEWTAFRDAYNAKHRL